MRGNWGTSALALLLSGCASGAAVQASAHLPVRNVVLYRSGVGYFERAGSFEGRALRFRVQPHEVGDFLASLTTVEHTGGGVRSVSFESPDATAHDHDHDHDDEADEEEAPPPPVDVTLAFGADGAHALNVAYVVGAPVWRPSYRVVFDGADPTNAKALLQAWAVVQNGSGEDWRDIKLALTTGAPISFRSDLGTPIVPERPLVSDTGEVVQAVPTGETVIAQDDALSEQAAPAPVASAPMREEREADEELADEPYKPAPKELAKRSRSPGRGGMGAGLAASAALLEQSVHAQASASAVTETVTRYDLSEPVTVPDGGSTMVALISTRVPGEQALLFAPDPGVSLSRQHPFSVVRLSNASGAVLEKGPISVLANGAFLGQGLLDTLPRDAQAFVPFALDKSVVIEPAEEYGDEQGALVRVQRGLITVQRFSQRKTTYRIRNGGATAVKLYVRHPRWGAAELLAPPPGTELAPEKALVPVQAEPRAPATLAVVERTPVELQLTIMDPRAAEAIGLYLSGPAASDPASEPLRAALALRDQRAALEGQIAEAEREQAEVNEGASEARKNLKAIEKLARASDLRARLVERLKQLDARNAALITKLIEARTRRAELDVRLQEALEGVSLTPKT
ncbi:MAG: DUF4139 domain-containing protein [Polyangiales bacterium]